MPRLDPLDRETLDCLLERGLLDAQEHARAIRKAERPRRLGVTPIVGLAVGPAPLIADQLALDEGAVAGKRLQAQLDVMSGAPALAKSSAEAELKLTATVVVGKESISLDGGASVIKLEETPEGLKIPDDEQKGQLISKLYDGLLEAHGRHSMLDTLRTGNGEFRGEVLIAADADTPFSVLRSVMYTAGQAQYGEFQIAVQNPWLGQSTAVETSLPAIGPPRAYGYADEDEKPPLSLAMVLSAKGISILGADMVLHPDGFRLAAGEERPATVPCTKSDGCIEVDVFDWEEVSRLLRLIKDEYPDDQNVIIVPENDMSHDVLIRAIDVARWAPLPPDPEEGESAHSSWQESRSDAFTSSIIAGGAL